MGRSDLPHKDFKCKSNLFNSLYRRIARQLIKKADALDTGLSSACLICGGTLSIKRPDISSTRAKSSRFFVRRTLLSAATYWWLYVSIHESGSVGSSTVPQRRNQRKQIHKNPYSEAMLDVSGFER